MAEYNGPDRRVERSDGRAGRRRIDLHCPEHVYIQEATKEHRKAVCGKISGLNAEIEKMVPWKIFVFVFTLAVMIVGSGFGFFGVHLNRLSDKQDRSLEFLRTTLTGIATNQAVMAEQLEAIKTRQNVLRDAHLRDKKTIEDWDETGGKK